MFQRIQSIYLIISTALVVGSYFLPFGFVAQLPLRTYGVKQADVYLDTVNSYWFHLPLAAIVLMGVFALFSFSNRKRQMAIVRSTFILFALSYSLLAFYVMDAQKVLLATFQVSTAVFFPYTAMLCNWLALRAIRKDEELVKSVDRIR